MTQNEAKEFIRQNPQMYFKRDKSGKGYICPLCGSGSGKNGTGLTTQNGVTFKCWGKCGFSGDVIEFIGEENHLSHFPKKLQRACEIYNVILDDVKTNKGINKRGENYKTKTTAPTATKAINEETPEDFSSFYAECVKHRAETDYLTKRGISERTQEYFNIGFCANWKSPAALKKGYNPPASPRIIIPTSKFSYLARDIRPDESLSEKERDYTKAKTGKQCLFNAKALTESTEPIFITEGEIDAMSFYEVGYEATALGSVAYKRNLIEYVKEHRPSQTLILTLDNDEAGNQAGNYLAEELQKEQILFYRANIYGENKFKDPNEFLKADREGFKKAVENAAEEAKEVGEKEKREYIDNNSAIQQLNNFIGEISTKADTPVQPTGFARLDEALDGGLYEGLYCIGAISSLGKTTFALQIADSIAKSGRDILIFSLEMAKTELMAKSLSRLTAEIRDEKKLYLGGGKVLSVRDVLSKQRHENFNSEKIELFTEALGRYSEFAKNIFVLEGIGNIGAAEIRDSVKKHIHLTGNKPVIIIDYLQIIAPYNERATDKQNTDKAVLELKRISRDFKIPVIGISSFNRENYSATASMQAFKESGAIEYSSDVLIALQLKGAGEKEFDVDKAKAQFPREVELKILKNRNGETGKTVYFEYYANCNFFREIENEENKDEVKEYYIKAR